MLNGTFFKVVVTRFGISGKSIMHESDNFLQSLQIAVNFLQDTSIRTVLLVNKHGEVKYWCKRENAESDWHVELLGKVVDKSNG